MIVPNVMIKSYCEITIENQKKETPSPKHNPWATISPSYPVAQNEKCSRNYTFIAKYFTNYLLPSSMILQSLISLPSITNFTSVFT